MPYGLMTYSLDFGHRSVFVDHNKGNESFVDMWLMSLCQHHIVANSSFSWWGAWLNRSKRKQVFAPSPWYQAGALRGVDPAPSSWVRIPRTVGPVPAQNYQNRSAVK